MRVQGVTCQQAFGDVLKRVRLHRHLTPERLAADSGVALSRILRFENGMIEPSLSEVFLLGAALGTRPCSIVEGIEFLISSPPERPRRQNGGEAPSLPQSRPEQSRHEDTVK